VHARPEEWLQAHKVFPPGGAVGRGSVALSRAGLGEPALPPQPRHQLGELRLAPGIGLGQHEQRALYQAVAVTRRPGRGLTGFTSHGRVARWRDGVLSSLIQFCHFKNGQKITRY
jgi:hypothetical protein